MQGSFIWCCTHYLSKKWDRFSGFPSSYLAAITPNLELGVPHMFVKTAFTPGCWEIYLTSYTCTNRCSSVKDQKLFYKVLQENSPIIANSIFCIFSVYYYILMYEPYWLLWPSSYPFKQFYMTSFNFNSQSIIL